MTMVRRWRAWVGAGAAVAAFTVALVVLSSDFVRAAIATSS